MDTGEPPAGCDPLLSSTFVLPLLAQLSSWSQASDRGERRRPVVGLNGPVGAGKSTLGRQLEELAPHFGLKLMVASIDDLYLGWPERGERLAGNPFGVTRVPPGSHDLPQLMASLQTWREGGSLRLPRFDKTLAGGEGDRAGWREQTCDALVLEGWLMGCRVLPEADLTALIKAAAAQAGQTSGTPVAPAGGLCSGSQTSGAPPLTPEEWDWLPRWNRELESYQPLWQAMDGLWLLRPQHWGLPRRWRFQAEARQRRAGGGWLAAETLERIVRASLCSLPPALYQDPLIPPAALAAAPEGPRDTNGPGDAFGPGTGVTKALPYKSTPPRGGVPGEIETMGALQTDSRAAMSGEPHRGRLEREDPGDDQGERAPDRGGPGYCWPSVQAVAWLDGRRRCLRAWAQDSASPSSSATG